MAVGFYKAVTSLPYPSGLPEDVAQTALYFGSTGGATSSADADALLVYLEGFWNDVHPGSADSINEFIGDQVDRTADACTIDFYLKTGSIDFTEPWGSPVETRSFTLGASTAGVTLPAECAVAFSFHADLTNIPETQTNPDPPPAVIRPAARRRGRIYIGPLQASAGEESGPNNDLLPTAAFRNCLAAAGAFLIDDVPANMVWDVVSKVGNEANVVVGGYIDNAFDTQRRRGTAPTARTPFGV